MYRSDDYRDDLMNADPSMPATNPIYLGSAFEQQTMRGPTFNDPGDDRVTFIGDAYDPTVQHMRSQVLPADQDGAPYGPADFDQAYSPDAPIARPTTPGQRGSFIQQTIGKWYATLRPQAGYPLNPMPDFAYAQMTGDEMGDRFGTKEPYLQPVGVRYVPERALDLATIVSGGAVIERKSMAPSTDQAVYDGFDTALGAQTWSGQKDAQERPIADPGPWFYDPLRDAIPSLSGAAGAMHVQDQVYATPLTFRAPPVPWDQGTNSDNGFYVESGY